MPRAIIKSRLHSSKYRHKNKQKVNKTKSNLPPHLQSFKNKNYYHISSSNFDSFISNL